MPHASVIHIEAPWCIRKPGNVQVGDASSTLPIASCHLQDDTANHILRCLTTAAQSPSSTSSMPSLSIRVGKHATQSQCPSQCVILSECTTPPPRCFLMRQCGEHARCARCQRNLAPGFWCFLQYSAAADVSTCTAAHSACSIVQGKDGVMGQPLVKRLTVRSGLHPDSGAPAHLAILHVSPSVPAPAKADDARSSAPGVFRTAQHCA